LHILCILRYKIYGIVRLINMILTFILTLLYSLLATTANVLPAGQVLPSSISVAFQYVIYQISTWSFIFPLSTVFTILFITISIEIALWGFHGFIWVYNRIRGA